MLSHEKFQLSSQSQDDEDESGGYNTEEEAIPSTSAAARNIFDSDDSDNDSSGDENNLDDDTVSIDEDEIYDEEDLGDVNGIEVIKCAAHTLALGVDDSIKKLKAKRMFKKFKKLAKFLRTPNEIIKIKQRKLPLPKIENATRWNSSYDMVDSLMELKPYCEEAGIKILRASDWEFGRKFLIVFKPAKVCTKKLQGEQVTLSDFFKMWNDLMLRVKKISENEAMAVELYRNLERRQASLYSDNNALQAALYLDPRFRQIFTKMEPSYFNEATAQKHLFQIYKNLKSIQVSFKSN